MAALRGYAALLYTGAATVANRLVDEGLAKANAAVLARHDMAQVLALLPPEVRGYLRRNADAIMTSFEESFRNRIPDFDDRFREFEEVDDGPVDLLDPPVDWEEDTGLELSPENYLLGGLDPGRAPEISQEEFMAMNTLPDLDTRHRQGLRFALVVLEVRSYGARHVSAADAQAHHERLAAVVRELGARDVQWSDDAALPPGVPALAGAPRPADQARAYLTVGSVVRPDPATRRRLVEALVTGPASPDDRRLALELLRAATDEELQAVFGPRGDLLAVLERGIPDGDMRAELESFLRQRFVGGGEWLAMGRVVVDQVQLAGTLSGFPDGGQGVASPFVSLDQRSALIARVRSSLSSLGWQGNPADDEILRVYELLEHDPAAGRGTAAQAELRRLVYRHRKGGPDERRERRRPGFPCGGVLLVGQGSQRGSWIGVRPASEEAA